ncbi:hypothetical protein Q8A73_008455 [Channa argus]|nr:hypothetical protein Q8A73_008455 [Channa argus]
MEKSVMRPHSAISTRAPGYGPLQWADCQLPWITISQRVLWAIRKRGAFHSPESACTLPLAETALKLDNDPSASEPSSVSVSEPTDLSVLEPFSELADIKAAPGSAPGSAVNPPVGVPPGPLPVPELADTIPVSLPVPMSADVRSLPCPVFGATDIAPILGFAEDLPVPESVPEPVPYSANVKPVPEHPPASELAEELAVSVKPASIQLPELTITLPLPGSAGALPVSEPVPESAGIKPDRELINVPSGLSSGPAPVSGLTDPSPAAVPTSGSANTSPVSSSSQGSADVLLTHESVDHTSAPAPKAVEDLPVSAPELTNTESDHCHDQT